VVPRKIVAVLVMALPVLITTFAVLMAGQLLAGGIGDAGAQRALRGVAIGVLALVSVDLVLLIGALGVNSLERRDRHREPPDEVG
jgi:hypothetical protein